MPSVAALGGQYNPNPWTDMIRKILFAFFLVAVVAGVLAGIKALQIRAMIDQTASFSMPAAVVSTVSATA